MQTSPSNKYIVDHDDDVDADGREPIDLDREHASRARFDGVNQSVRADCGFYDDFDDDFHYGVAAPLKTRTTTTTTTKDAK